MLGRLRRRNGGGQAPVIRSFQPGGLIVTAGGDHAASDADVWLADAEAFKEWELVYYLQQLVQEGIAPTLDREVILPWDGLYQLLADPAHEASVPLLHLPPLANLVPSLSAGGSLSDSGFAVSLSWQQQAAGASVQRTGGVVATTEGEQLLSAAAWELAETVAAFARRTDRSRAANEREWGRLRTMAVATGARLDDFLSRTVVLTLETLDLRMTVADAAGVPVVEVAPLAAGAPDAKWLATFDTLSTVQERYDLAAEDGSLIRVVPDDDVRAVLREIKRMPGRRISGKRAAAFLRNPYALLGEAMASVLPPERFEALRKKAGVCFFSFALAPQRTASGHVSHIDLSIYPEDEQAEAPPLQTLNRTDAERFARALDAALRAEEPCFLWRGRDLDIRGEAAEQLAKLRALLDEPWGDAQPAIRLEDVYDLSRYSERIVGIGVYKPIRSPFIQQTNGAWLPETIEPVISWQPPGGAEPVTIRLDERRLDEMASALHTAEAQARPSIELDALPSPMAVADAREILAAFRPERSPLTGFAEEQAVFEGPPAQETAKPRQTAETLIEAINIDEDAYAEERGRFPAFDTATPPILPTALRPDVALKPHQHVGVAWLQHLWRHMPDVRGCVFADDMGLGKTLQLLAFVHWYLEQPDARDPVLIVAPVSLLENWRNEIAKFFLPHAGQPLTLYGNALSEVRLDKAAVDKALLDKGLTRFLRPNWLGGARIVLTTYETLHDQEFSLSATRWAIMVCDEAQKIKTPSALVTRAAKKQNVGFKIACTGTPVENSLTDLWCLFDFVQPGLLGPLNQFGRTYSRPIEAQTPEQKAAVERLRALIEPQVLRRTKKEVADLPRKIPDLSCMDLPISSRQMALYTSVVDEYRAHREAMDQASDRKAGGAALLSMLHRLRNICADPRDEGMRASPNVALDDYCRISPKMRWLMDRLAAIQAAGEKVIVFTEFRDIQRLLQHLIGKRFGIRVSVVNGDTDVGTAVADSSRQGIIDAFQRKPDFNVIILSTTAVGFGVNIQAANHVVHFTRPWNPAKED
jgi:hypothetical protein